MASLFKDAKLIKNDGTEIAASSLDGKVLALYFSASWCGPCRRFTPELITYYNEFKANHAEKDNFEIIFLSSDRDEASFKDYFGKMPWYALPHGHPIKQELSGTFSINGIPCLIFVDKDGTVNTKSGRGEVSQDPEGENWPYHPKPLTELIGSQFVKSDGSIVGPEAIKGKHIGLYFSAHWCPPCRAFTPKFAETYKKMKAANKDFEVIFVSSDHDEKSFKEYLDTMPWLAIPYGDEGRKQKAGLSERFEVSGIPSLVILDPELNVVNGNGRAAVSGDPEGKNFPWEPQAISVLDDTTIQDINDGPFLVTFVKKDDVQSTFDMLKPLAEEAKDKSVKGKPYLRVFVADVTSKPAEAVRGFLELDDTAPQALLLNIPKQSKKMLDKVELDVDYFKPIFADFASESVEWVGLA